VVALTAIVGSDVKIAQVIGRGCRALRMDRFPEQARFGPKAKMVLLDPARQFHPARLGLKERLGIGGVEIERLPKDPEKRAAMAIGRLERLPLAVAVEPIEAWSGRLRDLALRALGPEAKALPQYRPMMDPTERSMPGTRSGWVEAARLLQDAEKSIEPRDQRAAIKLIVGRGQATVTGGGMFEAPMEVGRGVVSDLAIFLRWVAARVHVAKDRTQVIRGWARIDHIRRAQIMATARVVIPESILLPGEVASDRVQEGPGDRDENILTAWP